MREKTGYIGIDCEPEWTHHPKLLEYQLLLSQWEHAYTVMKKSPTPDHKEQFYKIDQVVKNITLYIKEMTSQLD